jgi:hypothetical protein
MLSIHEFGFEMFSPSTRPTQRIFFFLSLSGSPLPTLQGDSKRTRTEDGSRLKRYVAAVEAVLSRVNQQNRSELDWID